MDIEYCIIFTNLLVFVIAPFLPNLFYDYFVETYVGAVILLLVVLYSITYGYLVTVSTFTAVAALYAESHVRKASKVKKVAPSTLDATGSVVKKAVGGSMNLLPDEVHPDAHTPDDESVTFLAKNEEDADVFKPVDRSINEKEALPTISLSKDATNVYEESNLSEKQD
jgi:hypothetical protein